MKQTAELTALQKVWHLQEHADLQAARHLQAQGRVAWLSKLLAESAQQLTALGVVEGQAAKLVIEKSSHPLRRLGHKEAGLDVDVQQLIPAAEEKTKNGEGGLNLEQNPVPEDHDPAGFSALPGRNGKLDRGVHPVGQKSQSDCGPRGLDFHIPDSMRLDEHTP